MSQIRIEGGYMCGGMKIRTFIIVAMVFLAVVGCGKQTGGWLFVV